MKKTFFMDLPDFKREWTHIFLPFKPLGKVKVAPKRSHIAPKTRFPIVKNIEPSETELKRPTHCDWSRPFLYLKLTFRNLSFSMMKSPYQTSSLS